MRFLRFIWLPVALVALIIVALVQSADAGQDVDGVERVEQASPLTPVLSARRLPTALTTPGADARLQFPLVSITDRSPSESCLVVATPNGRRIFDHNGDLPLVPASTNKILTAAAVLDELGAQTMFVTTVSTEAPIVDDVVAGDLYLVGGGDPLLATDAYVATFPVPPVVHTDFESLADQLVARGVTEVSGNVIGDDSRFDTVRYVESWPSRYREQGQTGPLSALSVDDGFSSFPDLAGSSRPRPSTDPAAHAAGELIDALEERGVTVDGTASSGVAPVRAQELASVTSPVLSDIVAQMLTESDNSTAELLLKELGRLRSGSGATSSGAVAAADVLAENGIDTAPVTLIDGSGLDVGNRLTCGVLIDVLGLGGPDSAVANGLAVAGETGSLAGRFVDSAAAGRLRAKTGSLGSVTALSGFVETFTERSLVFAYIVNDVTIPEDYLLLQEELGAALVRYPEGPRPSAVGPLPLDG